MEIYRACFQARPSPSLLAPREPHDAGQTVGPVITDNLDVPVARAGLHECFVRRGRMVRPRPRGT
ncbi:hypothetical protein AB0I49_07190 [Streptomyces sp. NPDC050617]|uniref:hypothetical protein n=1 Tax=Streptomyces sp. NPDC050617 TaxID=3154628 RepID=UPI003418407C